MAEIDIKKYKKILTLFPNPANADEDGLLAMGGDLEPETLLAAYSKGIFPWFNEGEPILWWCLTPRCVLFPENFHLPRKSAKKIAANPFELTFNHEFERVMAACGLPRKTTEATWITKRMIAAYSRLHSLGYVHSVEAWRDGELVGGLYGLAIGRVFCGESMFHFQTEASRATMAGLVALLRQKNFLFIDCQQESPHMLGMGAIMLEKTEYFTLLASAIKGNTDFLDHNNTYSLKGKYTFNAAENLWIPD